MIPSKFKPYITNLVLIWFAILIYRTNLYYVNLLRSETKLTLLYLALAYTILGFFYYLFQPAEKISTSKGSLVFSSLKKVFVLSFKLEKQEKTAILFMIVKFFFLPIMLNFFFSNFFSVKNNISILLDLNGLSMAVFNNNVFPFLLSLIFLIDTLWFSFGYTFESSALNNKVRSVEPTFLGWAVALICYPPFNSIIGKHLHWYANDYVLFFNAQLTFIMRIAIILLLSIYVFATLALGAKSSNLTNRGIVARGPYAIIRHPAYISKNLAWWLTIIPVFSIPAVISMGVWSTIYHLRSLTEERHLLHDPDYQEYCKKVKYRYIPYIY